MRAVLSGGRSRPLAARDAPNTLLAVGPVLAVLLITD
jgi:hypothetical protein